MAWYRTGTISVTNGSTTVTGSGTSWVAGAGIGEALYAPDGRIYEIANIASNTSLTLASAYLGANQSGQSYAIIPSQSYIRDLAADASSLISQYAGIASGAGAGKFTDGSAATPGIAFSSDVDTGIYRASTNTLGIAAGGVSQMTVNTSGANIPVISNNPTLSSGTANGVLYLNGSKVATSGSSLSFDGSNLGIGTSSPSYKLDISGGSARISNDNGLRIAGTTSVDFTTNASGANLDAFTAGASLIFKTQSVEGMRLTSTGLGIGTSSPTTRLQLTKANATTGLGNGGLLTLENTDGGAFDQRAEILFKNAGQVTSAISSSYTGFAAGPQYAGALIFATKGTADSAIVERLRLDSSGNLGLGVTPSAWGSGIKAIDSSSCGGFVGTTGGVNVVSNAYYNGSNWIYKTSTHASYYEQNLANQGKHAWFTAPSGTAGNTISFTQAMTLDASGNLGVGTANPQYRAHVSSTDGGVDSWVGSQNAAATSTIGAGFIAIAGSSSYYSTFKQRANGDAEVFHCNPTGSLLFATGAIERARIDSSGNLLLGTTVPGYQNSNSITLEASYGYSVFNHVAGTASGNLYVAFGYGAIGAGSITQNGTTSVSYNTSSDYRLKNITGPVQNSGAYIDSLNPVEGTWKADGSTFVGLIAHEVQEVSRTQVATGEKDGAEMQSMDYSNSELIANLIAEVQSLRKRLAILEAK